MIRPATGSRILGRAIMDYRKQHTFSREDLAENLGVTKSLVDKWEVGNRMPTIENLFTMADMFKVNPIKLLILTLPSDTDLETNIKQLQEKLDVSKKSLLNNNDVGLSKKYHDLIIELDQLQRLRRIKETYNKDSTKTAFAQLLTLKEVAEGRVAAGDGVVAMLEDGAGVLLPENYPVDWVLKIAGDSMEPLLSDGDRVWVKAGNSAVSHDMVIALVNGEEATVKYLIDTNGGGYILRAVNSKYPDRPLQREDKILGVVYRIEKRVPPPPTSAIPLS